MNIKLLLIKSDGKVEGTKDIELRYGKILDNVFLCFNILIMMEE